MPINKCVSLRQLKKYQSGRVSERERIAVEGHLSTCELCQYTINSIGAIDEKELQEDLPFLKSAITNRLFEYQRKKRRQKLLKIAAALLFLMTIGFAVQFSTKSKISSSDLYTEYYQPYDVPDSLVRSAASPNIPVSAPLAEAIATYKNLPYEKSTDNIPTAFDYNPEEAALTQLLKGLILLEKGQTEEAITSLKKAQSSKTKFSEDATWYLALAHLKEKNSTNSIQYLDQILAIQNGFYYNNAKTLKAQLKRN